MSKFLNSIKNLITGGSHPAMPAGEDLLAKEVVKHFEKYFGKEDFVLKAKASDEIPIDIHIINPTPERNYYTLFTTGMSRRPMDVPDELEGYEYAELMLHLPSDWPFDREDESSDWPIEWLKIIAKFPHQNNTWLFYGHTVPNGEDATALADDTEFGCMLIGTTNLLGSDKERNAFSMLEFNASKVIYCFTLFPLYPEEMEYRLDHSAEDLFSLLQKNQISDVIDIHRGSVA